MDEEVRVVLCYERILKSYLRLTRIIPTVLDSTLFMACTCLIKHSVGKGAFLMYRVFDTRGT